MNIVPNRIFSSASVQTDSPSPPSSLEVTLVNVISQPAAIPHSNKSPVQLPSPVSADHGRDPHSDNLAQLEEDMDDVWFNFECISLHVKPIVFRYLELNAVSHRWTLVPLAVLNLLFVHPYLRRTRNQRRSLQKAINRQ